FPVMRVPSRKKLLVFIVALCGINTSKTFVLSLPVLLLPGQNHLIANRNGCTRGRSLLAPQNLAMLCIESKRCAVEAGDVDRIALHHGSGDDISRNPLLPQVMSRLEIDRQQHVISLAVLQNFGRLRLLFVVALPCWIDDEQSPI